MSSVVPSTDLGKLEFYEAHLAAWGTAPANIGLTAGQVTSLNTLTTAARTAFNGALTAREAAKAATGNMHNKINSMHALGSDLIKIIKAYAATQNDPNVFVLAQIPEPAPRTPAPPPEAPTDLSASMNADGSIRLSWKGTLAYRQFFSVWRQTPSEDAPQQIAAIAAKEFVDLTVPRGLAQTIYSVRAHRDAAVSEPCPNLIVYFGVLPSEEGQTAASVNGQVIGYFTQVPANAQGTMTTKQAA